MTDMCIVVKHSGAYLTLLRGAFSHTAGCRHTLSKTCHWSGNSCRPHRKYHTLYLELELFLHVTMLLTSMGFMPCENIFYSQLLREENLIYNASGKIDIISGICMRINITSLPF